MELDPSVILILRSIFFRSFANVATFFNVAGTKLDFWTFAKGLIENDKVLDIFCVFPIKFLSKTIKRSNEIHENDIDNDSNEPVPEYDTAIEHEESNTKGKVDEVLELKKGWIVSNEDDLDLKETDEATQNLNDNVQPEEGRLRPHCSNF